MSTTKMLVKTGGHYSCVLCWAYYSEPGDPIGENVHANDPDEPIDNPPMCEFCDAQLDQGDLQEEAREMERTDNEMYREWREACRPLRG